MAAPVTASISSHWRCRFDGRLITKADTDDEGSRRELDRWLGNGRLGSSESASGSPKAQGWWAHAGDATVSVLQESVHSSRDSGSPTTFHEKGRRKMTRIRSAALLARNRHHSATPGWTETSSIVRHSRTHVAPVEVSRNTVTMRFGRPSS